MYDVVIIGSGPAGLTAAIYSSRALQKTLVIQGSQPGGQLTTTSVIENFPGFPEDILGPELMMKMQKQAQRFGTEMVTDTIVSIKDQGLKMNEGKKEHTFHVKGQASEYEAKAVIVAVGAQAKHLGIPSEEIFRGKGISHCATCDGFFFKGKNIAVLGGGDTAMEEAIFLTKFASSVTIIHRREGFRASPIMVERAKANPKIKFLLNQIVEEFIGDTTIKAIRLKENIGNTGDKGKTMELPIDGVFVAIGHTPATDFLKGFIQLSDTGYILLQPKSMSPIAFHTKTSVPGIFAAGDCVDPTYRQGIVAAGLGGMAALDVGKYLEEQK